MPTEIYISKELKYTEEDLRLCFEAAREKNKKIKWTRHMDNHYTWDDIKYETFEDYLETIQKASHKGGN